MPGTLIMLAVVAVMILPFGWSHQMHSKFPLGDMKRVSHDALTRLR